MATDKQCSDGLADLSLQDLKDVLDWSLKQLYLSHVAGITMMLLVLTLFLIDLASFSTVLLPVISWLNQMRYDRFSESRIIKCAIVYREKIF
ncbi:hypothetical protein [Colwellia piezophila]|uniref:hypothetical protein n=1 Tax=Colwellia piezophila TaxID=211668 RepID=UPI0012F749D4|nr:hypothetical protein [Colwellia piezophila]